MQKLAEDQHALVVNGIDAVLVMVEMHHDGCSSIAVRSDNGKREHCVFYPANHSSGLALVACPHCEYKRMWLRRVNE